MDYFAEMESRIPKGGVRTRFAPSPTGYMHVGNLRTALYTWLIARHAGGRFILRIEDTDQGRLVEDAVDVIYKTMADCKLFHDEGPDIGGPVGPYIQTERREIYQKYAALLIEKGGAYRCFCDEERLNEMRHSNEGKGAVKYDGHCANLSQAEIDEKLSASIPYVIRQRIPQEGSTTFSDVVFGDITVENKELDDNVLIKSDGLPTYNFANVIDDHLMGITHVVRGSEYLSSTPKYNLLYQAFGWEIPTYIHCPPVMRDAQHKMSKRYGDPSYEDLVSMGYLSEAVLNYVALLGWSPRGEEEIFSLNELASVFDIHGISKSPAIFDVEKLTHFNSTYIKAMSPDAFHTVAEPYIRSVMKNPQIDTKLIAPLLQPRCLQLTDIPERVDFFDTLPEYETTLYVHKKSKTTEASSLSALKDVSPILTALTDWNAEAIHNALFGLAEQQGVKNSLILWPVRVAVSGKAMTPGGGVELCAILGKEETLRRIQIGIEKLAALAS
ncbi:MAG: glutamate--tRNA ligase [Oscillospiraceae bacterium]|jgi:glutamyl-tRNA synthetase|nr:glutamate--tRNA ligase [Oscillospiraceae bacterium]